MVSLDFRSRTDDDIVPVGTREFFSEQLPDLLDAHHDLAAPGAAELGVDPFTFTTPQGSWTMQLDGGRLSLREGDGGAGEVKLTDADVSDVVNDLKTPMTFLTGGTLDMATGNYGSTTYMSDEGATHTNNLFNVDSHANKISYSCTQYTRKATPGSQWVYHTSDTYIAGTMMNAYLKNAEGSTKDLFTDLIVNDLWTPLNLSPTAKYTRRSWSSAGAATFRLVRPRSRIL